MKDRIRFSEAFKLKVMEELRDRKWKSAIGAASAYGIAPRTVYGWLRKYGFEHLEGRLVYVKTRDEADEVKRLKAELKAVKFQLADKVLDCELEKEFLKCACERLGMPVEELKKKDRSRVAHEVSGTLRRGVAWIARKLRLSRNWFYKSHRARVRREVCEDLVVEFAREERADNPRAGTRKVLAAIRPRLGKAGISLGRDGLHAILSRNGMLVERRKRPTCRTTRQDPALEPSPNLVKDMEITAPNQAVCADITYIYTDEGFLFLSLAMDMFARDIVGFDISDSLTADGPVRALRMAARTLPPGARPVHHSDRGCQYASHAFRDELERLGWTGSMTEVLHCYENAMAERLNGILKGEYFLDRGFRTKGEAARAVRDTIRIYNTRRLHGKLGYMTPAAFRAKLSGSVA